MCCRMRFIECWEVSRIIDSFFNYLGGLFLFSLCVIFGSLVRYSIVFDYRKVYLFRVCFENECVYVD